MTRGPVPQFRKPLFVERVACRSLCHPAFLTQYSRLPILAFLHSGPTYPGAVREPVLPLVSPARSRRISRVLDGLRFFWLSFRVSSAFFLLLLRPLARTPDSTFRIRCNLSPPSLRPLSSSSLGYWSFGGYLCIEINLCGFWEDGPRLGCPLHLLKGLPRSLW